MNNQANKDVILYVGGFELPDRNAAAQRVIANGKIFKELGYSPAFLGIDKTLAQGTDVESTHTNHFGFECWAHPYPNSKKEWLRSITSAEHVAALVQGPLNGRVHSIICYNHPALSQLKIRKICKQIGANYIADATEWYDNAAGGLIFRVVKGLDTALRMRYVHFKTDSLITTSPYLERFYETRVKNIVNLPTLYDADYMSSLATDSENTKKKKNVIRFMYAGSSFTLDRLAKDRSNVKDRLDQIVKIFDAVFPEHQNFELNIFGLEKDNFISAFPELEPALTRMADHVFFHGRVPHKQIVDETVTSDYTIFIRHLSRVIEAGFASKFSESMTFGTPVISNIYSSIAPFVREGENHIALELHNLEAQASTMRTVLSAENENHQKMKAYCADNKPFDYRAFTPAVGKFFEVLEKG